MSELLIHLKRKHLLLKLGKLEQFLSQASQSAKLQGCAFENNCGGGGMGVGVGETVLLMIESQEEKIPNY